MPPTRLISQKILNIHRPYLLWNKGDKNDIKTPFKLSLIMKLVKNIHDIIFKNPPTSLKEGQRKTIRVQGLIAI
jgi:hypothetical protein